MTTKTTRSTKCSQCNTPVLPGAGYRHDGYRPYTLCQNCETIENAINSASDAIDRIARLCGLDYLGQSLIRQSLRRTIPAALITPVIEQVSQDIKFHASIYEILGMISAAKTQAACKHAHVFCEMSGGFHLSFGEATDDLSEEIVCADCGKILRSVSYEVELPY